MLKNLNQYHDYVNQTLNLQKIIGLDGKNGILVELRTIKDNIQNKLYAIDNKPLNFLFLEMRLLEKDFSNTLDIKIVKRLLTLISAFNKLLKIGNIPISHKENLQLYIAEYHDKVSQLMNKIIEIQSYIANSTLQFQRIFPNLQKSQHHISELITSIETKFHEQLQISKFQTIAIFTIAFIILAFFILLQVKNAQFLVQRLRRLTDCMHHIGSGEFNKIANLPQGNDEIGTLANTFEEMACQIKSQITIIEQEKSEKLLLNILPPPIAKRLKRREELIADRFEHATVLFCDIVNFTNLSANVTPEELVQNLNGIFTLFDGLTSSYHLEKIKTIGDAYMIVGGVPNPCDDHAERVANVGLKMIKLVQNFSQEKGLPFSIRVGIHSGAVVAGVIGVTKFAYDLWGDTVNTASRMESHGKPNKVHCSESVYKLLKRKFSFEKRGFIQIKGKGEMKTYFLKDKTLTTINR